MNKLPKWVIPDTHPALFDTESATTIEMTAKLYGAMNGLIEDYNNFVERVDANIEAFKTSTEKDLEVFETALRQEFQDFIDVVNLKILGMDKVINDAVDFMETNIEKTTQNVVEEALKNETIYAKLNYDADSEALTLVLAEGE